MIPSSYEREADCTATIAFASVDMAALDVSRVTSSRSVVWSEMRDDRILGVFMYVMTSNAE